MTEHARQSSVGISVVYRACLCKNKMQSAHAQNPCLCFARGQQYGYGLVVVNSTSRRKRQHSSNDCVIVLLGRTGPLVHHGACRGKGEFKNARDGAWLGMLRRAKARTCTPEGVISGNAHGSGPDTSASSEWRLRLRRYVGRWPVPCVQKFAVFCS